jgi:hypothetical protein
LQASRVEVLLAGAVVLSYCSIVTFVAVRSVGQLRHSVVVVFQQAYQRVLLAVYSNMLGSFATSTLLSTTIDC